MFSYGKRSQVRYHGLRNQGATCYLNSVLQVLFMTKDYRDAVKRHRSENRDTDFIDHHLKTLFDDLQDRISNTKEITCKLGIDRVYEQRDAAEYYEKILNLTSPEASQIFHGQLTHRTICSSCGDEADSDAAFWHLPLALVDPHSKSYSVKNGIKEYFKDADFSGENQMYCERCDDKSDATVKCLVKHHPKVLMLLLKRFEFNFNYMTYVKNNCSVKVPYTLKIPQNQMYKLYAVVDHLGDLRRGHHTATIKSQDDGRWYTFNDATVYLNDYQPFQGDQSETSAYLLFYRKVKVHADDTCNPNINEMSSSKDLSSAASDINDQVEEESEEAEQASNGTAKNEMNEEQRRAGGVRTGKVETTSDDKESKKREKSRRDYPDRDAEYNAKATLRYIGLNRKTNLGGSQDVKQHHDLQSVSVKKQGDRKRMKEVYEIREIRGDVINTKRKGQSESRHDYDQDGDLGNRRLGDAARNKRERKLSSTHTGHQGVSVVRQTKRQHNEKTKDAQSEADSPHRQEGSAGSRGWAEKQKVGRVERGGREDSQAKGKETFNKDRVGEISGSKKSKTWLVKTTEEEIRQTPSGPQIHIETEYKTLKKGKFKGKIRKIIGKSDLKKNPEVSLTESFSSLSLSDPGSPEQQKSLLEKGARKRKSEPDTQTEDSKKKVKKKKDKSNETPGCFSLLWTRRKGKKKPQSRIKRKYSIKDKTHEY